MNLYNFQLTCGEDRTLSMVARKSDMSILNLTGASITWRMGSRPTGSPANVAALEKTGAITSASAETFTVPITAADTDQSVIKSRQYWHQAIITIAGVVTIGAQGRVNLQGELMTGSGLYFT